MKVLSPQSSALSPASAVALDPLAWQKPRRPFDWDRAREETILRIIGALETNRRNCGSTDEISAKVRAAIGEPWASKLQISAVKTRRGVRMVIVETPNPAVAFELRPRLKALETALQMEILVN